MVCVRGDVARLHDRPQWRHDNHDCLPQSTSTRTRECSVLCLSELRHIAHCTAWPKSELCPSFRSHPHALMMCAVLPRHRSLHFSSSFTSRTSCRTLSTSSPTWSSQSSCAFRPKRVWPPLTRRTASQRAGSQGCSLKLLSMDVVDAESLEPEQVGEGQTCGKEQWGVFRNDVKERYGSDHKKMTRTDFSLKRREPECAWVKCDALNEKSACVRVRSGVLTTHSVAFKAVATVWTRNQEKDNYKSTTMASQLLDVCKIS